MTQLEQSNREPTHDPAPAAESTVPTKTQVSSPSQPTTPGEGTGSMTQQQAEAILTELKSIRKNIFFLLVIAGFFAARSILFHY